MSDVTDLEQLIEVDVLEALGEPIPEELLKPDTTREDEMESHLEEEIPEAIEEEVVEPEEVPEVIETPDVAKVVEPQAVNSIDLASLLSQLLNNKTIEITIKIKD